jgi:RNA polymerase sigma-B factor
MRTVPESLSKVPEEELAERYHATGDLTARRELVERFMPLARDLAYRYSYAREPVEDLVQVACLGLLKAIDRYDPGRSTRFASYAAPTILGELKRHFRDKGWAVHVPRRLQERVLRVNREVEVLSRELGRSPTVAELADALDCRREEVLEALEAAGSYDAASLDAQSTTSDGEGASLLETLGSEDGGYEAAEDRTLIAAGWKELSETESRALELRLSRLLRRALAQLEVADMR